jgi:hypothetical protein
MATPSNPALSLLSGLAKRRLILHFDVNRTLIQIDPAGGKTLDDVLNTNVAGRVAGDVDHGQKAWAVCPASDPAASPLPSPKTGQMFYDVFVDGVVHPRPAEMDTLAKHEADALWGQVSERRRELKHRFTSPGNPGEKFRVHFDQLKGAMVDGDGKEYHIVPSFFNLMNALSEADWPFSVVFRTFGTDLPSVLSEYAAFIRGEHPNFKPRGPRLASAAAALTAAGSLVKWCPQGHIYRNQDGLFLIWGASGRPPAASVDFAQHYAQANLTPLKVGYRGLAREIRALLEAAEQSSTNGSGVPCCGLVDYYPWWASHAEHQSAGKAFPVAQTDDVVEIFFDDNIRFGEPTGRSIVDVRLFSCSDEGSAAAEPEFTTDVALQEAYMCSVEPWDAILRPDYFLEETVKRIRLQQQFSTHA